MKITRYILPLALTLLIASCHTNMKYRSGIYEGEAEHSLPQGYGTLKTKRMTYQGFWNEGRENGQGTLSWGPYTYRGGFKDDKFEGYGELTYKDSIVYSGQWKQGKRYGKGIIRDSLGRKICGNWYADSLISGTRYDAEGTYVGQLTRKGVAEGHGSYLGSDGKYYEGGWKDDQRTHFGFSIQPHRQLRAGEWKDDRYIGERVVYSTDRIYGIDVSKYQHIHGRRRYAIAWNQVRISHLGTISKKKVNGTVDYKISFVYIKSTEGTSLMNPYYRSDYASAKANGIHVGTYHFFSLRSSASAQAYYFLKNSHLRSGDFPPVLDVEPLPSQIKRAGGVGVMFSRIRTWLSIVHRHTGVKPVLYISQIFVNRYLGYAPDIKKSYPIWIARYGEFKPDIRLVYWQLCPDGRVKGIHGAVDINVFNGYKNQFEEFERTQTIP
ncbi:MAG: glycosyl hydrolase family 25 [Prevotella sp.]|nr:glycosyl hydrolase family 25 [Prevotella sp.]MCI2079810.1 glycosyl hydrolase family 25 [Prevotella sp.]MCI2101966.1 glycosyl hydrolase family 25 [Prevotella sp.]